MITADKRLAARAAAEHLGVTLRQLKQMRDHRLIPYFRIGHRTTVYALSDLDTFLARRRVSAIGETLS